MIGSWDVNVNIDGMPQKVASAMAGLNLLGTEYTFIAYLGSQQVNGINHAVLAEQTVLTGRDTNNIVILIFNEKETSCDLINIERVVESGEKFGGIIVDPKTGIPAEALEVFENTFINYVGANIVPFALLATQMTNGVNYIFAATVTPVVPNAKSKIALVVVNQNTNEIRIADLLSSKLSSALGYAFTW